MNQDQKETIKRIVTYFDKLEDRIRGSLSRYPVVYTFIGGIAIVLFWRGVWHTADMLAGREGLLGLLFYEPVNLAIVIVILLATGLFVSYFIGDTILISGLKRQKKATEKTEKEISQEEAQIAEMRAMVKEIKEEVDIVKEIVEHEHAIHHTEEKKK